MAYRTFTRALLEEKLHLTFGQSRLFGKVEEVQPLDWLKGILDLVNAKMLVSEKARSEYIVAPVLLQVQSSRKDKISLLSGATMDVDRSLGLNGECDFLLVRAAYSEDVIAPIIGIVEAKDAALRKGYSQCSAQLVAAQRMNAKPDQPNKTVWGCVTNGLEWQFLKLIDNQIVTDEKVYSLNELPSILGIFLGIIDEKIV